MAVCFNCEKTTPSKQLEPIIWEPGDLVPNGFVKYAPLTCPKCLAGFQRAREERKASRTEWAGKVAKQGAVAK